MINDAVADFPARLRACLDAADPDAALVRLRNDFRLLAELARVSLTPPYADQTQPHPLIGLAISLVAGALIRTGRAADARTFVNEAADLFNPENRVYVRGSTFGVLVAAFPFLLVLSIVASIALADGKSAVEAGWATVRRQFETDTVPVRLLFPDTRTHAKGSRIWRTPAIFAFHYDVARNPDAFDLDRAVALIADHGPNPIQWVRGKDDVAPAFDPMVNHVGHGDAVNFAWSCSRQAVAGTYFVASQTCRRKNQTRSLPCSRRSIGWLPQRFGRDDAYSNALSFYYRTVLFNRVLHAPEQLENWLAPGGRALA